MMGPSRKTHDYLQRLSVESIVIFFSGFFMFLTVTRQRVKDLLELFSHNLSGKELFVEMFFNGLVNSIFHHSRNHCTAGQTMIIERAIFISKENFKI